MPLPPARRRVPALLLLAALAACGADEPPPPEQPPAEEPEVDDRQLLLDALSTRMGEASGKILALAENMPESAYDWRPADSVRSTREVFVHVAADNFFLPALMGVSPPGTTGITQDYATVQAYEARTPRKGQVLGELRASFRFLEEAFEETRGDLGREFTFAGETFTVGGMWAQAITHLHEHLGQTIAYARSNGVTPPWSLPDTTAP